MSRELQQWTRLAVALHWLVALLIVVNLGLGLLAEGMAMSPAKLNVYLWHKSVGMAVLALVGLRLAWRWTHAPPVPPASLTALERRAASATHMLLYLLMLALPLTGWWLNSVANFPFRWFGFFEVPAIAAPSEAMAALGETLHGALAWALLGLLVLHAGAALKHHLWDRDDVLRRMWPRPVGAVMLMVATLGLPALIWSQLDGQSTAAGAEHGSPQADAAMASVGPHDVLSERAAAPAWKTDMAQSQLGFVARYDEVPVEGVFTRFSPDIRFDPDNLAGSAFDVSIAIASLDTASRDRDDIIRQDAWFFVERFPKARFVTQRFKPLGEGRFEADARLSLRGREQAVPFVFEWREQGDGSVRLRAHVVLDRRDFNIGTGSWASDDSVGFAVDVHVDLRLQAMP